MMNAKTFLLASVILIICAMSSFGQGGMREVSLGGRLTEERLRSSDPVDSFVKVTLNEDKELILEFFEPATALTISIVNEQGVVIFEDTTNAYNTMQRFIDLSGQPDGYYEILMYNSSGINVSGGFWLE